MTYSLQHIGDLVKLCGTAYPQYKHMVGTVIRDLNPSAPPAASSSSGFRYYEVLINGRVHPYPVEGFHMFRVV